MEEGKGQNDGVRECRVGVAMPYKAVRESSSVSVDQDSGCPVVKRLQLVKPGSGRWVRKQL